MAVKGGQFAMCRKRDGTGITAGRSLAKLVFGLLAACLLAFPACRPETDDCAIECNDSSDPESVFSAWYEDTTCESCRAKFLSIREEVCGPGKNPDCVCFYFCENRSESIL